MHWINSAYHITIPNNIRYKTDKRLVIVARVNWAIASRGGVACHLKMKVKNLLHSASYQVNSTEDISCKEQMEFERSAGGERSSMMRQQVQQSYLKFKAWAETPLVCSKSNLKVLGHPQSAANTLLVGHLLEIVKNLILDKSRPCHVDTFCIGLSMGGRIIWLTILLIYNP